jgi:hypothetical protein
MQALHLMVGGMILFLLGGGALAAASVSHHHKSTVRGAANAAPAGPDRATALERYIADRSAELGSAKGRLTAVVSFRAYATEEQAKRAVGNANIVRWLVAAPGGEPDVTDDVKRWRQGVVRSAQDEIAEFEKLIPTLSQDPDFERQSRQDMETDRKLVAAVQGGTPLVFGVVVDADAALLRTIGTRAEVRLVDLAPSAKSANTDIHGLRPEEVVAAGDPSERPAL